MLTILTLLALIPSAPARQACPADAEPIPAALSAWSKGTPIAATSDADTAPALTIGATAALALHPSDHVRLIVPPRRASEDISHSGYAAIDIVEPGTYRVVLSDRAWIEMLREGKPIASATHGHGPRCSGMRKIVDFTLSPGHHVLQINGNPTATVQVMVVEAK